MRNGIYVTGLYIKYLNEITGIACSYLIMQKLICKPFSFSSTPGLEQVLKIILATRREGEENKEGREEGKEVRGASDCTRVGKREQ